MVHVQDESSRIEGRGVSRRMAGLTTSESPFIEHARNNRQLYIAQPYELYTPENHATWHELYMRMLPKWQLHANEHFLRGIASLCFDPDRVPKLEQVNRFLNPLTGFRAKAVSGYVPAFIFFDCLRNREFPTTITIRRRDRLDYLPEPDVFHDIAGHVPMHTDRMFADALVRLGECAHTAAAIVDDIRDETLQLKRLESIIRAMARFFWFTVEFGLMRSGRELKVYGSGLLSSAGEIAHAIESNDVQRYPLQLEWVINQSFEINHYQPLLFIVESFEHLFELVDELQGWVREGKLNNSAPGEPAVNDEDLKSFLHSGVVS